MTTDPSSGSTGIILAGLRPVNISVGLPQVFDTVFVIDVAEPGSSPATATLTTTANALIIPAGTVGSISQAGYTTTIHGTAAEITADIDRIAYSSNFAVSDSVTLTFTDAADHSASAGFAVDVTATNTAPGTATVAPYVRATAVGQVATLTGSNQIYTASAGTDTVTAMQSGSTINGGGAGSVLTLFADGTSFGFTNHGGHALVVQNAGSGTIGGGAAGSSLVAFLDGGPVLYKGDAGQDMLIGGAGASTVDGGQAGALTVFGGSGTMVLNGGHDAETVVGGSGAETIQAAASGGAYFGGSGGSQMTATGAGTFLIGAVGGDVLTSSALGGDGLVAGAGNETLNGGGSQYQNLLFAGAGRDQIMLGRGADTLVGGSGTAMVAMGAGSAAIYVGSGQETFAFTNGVSAQAYDLISGFKVGTDHLQLSAGLGVVGYASSGSTTAIALNDGTHVTLLGVAGATEATLFT
ncbi:hypothetical protein [Lichenicoccus sp.]|uniref:hypothetical protein n=1 Tax=Lichenicoccus sp. TaxID=2781899 RepID=UPI003D138D56